jgi:hypothetical protein
MVFRIKFFGHLKVDFRSARNFLKGNTGDHQPVAGRSGLEPVPMDESLFWDDWLEQRSLQNGYSKYIFADTTAKCLSANNSVQKLPSIS